MSFNIPLPPGMHAENDEPSDSDPETVENHRQRRAARARKTAAERASAAAEEEKRVAQAAAEAAQERFLLFVCCADEARVEWTRAHLETLKGPRPGDAEARLGMAGELRELARQRFEASELSEAVSIWLCAVHCLDFPAAERALLPEGLAERVFGALCPVLSNLAVAMRRVGDLPGARRAADLGLELVQELPYKDSKGLRLKLRFHRALVRGERRDFQGAVEDVRHVLGLDPSHEGARCVLRNAEVARKREGGPKQQRWKGPLTAALPAKVRRGWRQLVEERWVLAAAVLVGPVLAYVAAKVLGIA
mmetsp:Transcript_23304/g.59496  ORF Transcript_23304/g.59496 Transcript_23304/m.59496 type:complete len:306 (+) Transcript_23304:85-1002(+)